MIALRGSLLGVGTDIAGSIRIPAIACGVYGFRPSASRVPMGGQVVPARPGVPCFLPVAGPLATSARDLRLFLETIIRAQPWKLDSTSLAMPWHTSDAEALCVTGKLNVGYIFQDDKNPIEPRVLKALQYAVRKLEAAGHTLTRIESFPSLVEAESVAFGYFGLDNEHTALKLADDSGEPLVPSVLLSLENIPDNEKGTVKTLEDEVRLNVQKERFIEQWHRIFQGNHLDVLLLPGAAHPALPHDTWLRTTYTVVWNLLDNPSCIIPVETDDITPKYGEKYSIQVIGQRLQDETLIEAIEMIAKALR